MSQTGIPSLSSSQGRAKCDAPDYMHLPCDTPRGEPAIAHPIASKVVEETIELVSLRIVCIKISEGMQASRAKGRTTSNWCDVPVSANKVCIDAR